MVLFGGFLLLAILWRRDPARHKRMMLLACIDLLGAPLARVTSMAGAFAPPALDLITYAALVGLMLLWDATTQRRLRPDTLIGGALLVSVNAVALPLGATDAWLTLARALMGLVPPP